VVRLIDFLASGVDRPKPTTGRIFARDLSSAFDTMDHTEVVRRFIAIGLESWLLKWMISFLSGRTQVVGLGATHSRVKRVTTGSAQGEVLSGDILESLTDDIRVDDETVKTMKFADDTFIAALVSDKVDHEHYLESVKHVSDAFSDRNLHINPDKDRELIIDFSRNERITEALPQTIIKGQRVQRNATMKVVGIKVSEDFKTAPHVSDLFSKANSKLFLLYKMASIGMPEETLISFYEAAIRSPLEFASPAFHHSMAASEVKSLQRVQKRAFKVLERAGCDII
jgi:hypothetical protein